MTTIHLTQKYSSLCNVRSKFIEIFYSAFMQCVLCIYKMKNSISEIIKIRKNKRKTFSFILVISLKLDFAFSILHLPALLLLPPLHFVELQNKIRTSSFLYQTRVGKFFRIRIEGYFYLLMYIFYVSKRWVVVVMEFPFYYFWGYFIHFFAHFTNTCRHHFNIFFSWIKKSKMKNMLKTLDVGVFFIPYLLFAICGYIFIKIFVRMIIMIKIGEQ